VSHAARPHGRAAFIFIFVTVALDMLALQSSYRRDLM
jgi:hypothetical protein